MKTRQEIKRAAKQQIQSNLFTMFLVYLVWGIIAMVVIQGSALLIGKKMFDALELMLPLWKDALQLGLTEAVLESVSDFFVEFAGTIALLSLVVVVLGIVIGSMQEWGQVKNSSAMFKGENATFGNGFIGFKQFSPAFRVYLMKSLYLFLWSLIAIVTFGIGIVISIVKSYSYSCATFIKQENPQTGANAAITKSREMMNGNKMRLFVQDLSFIGWFMLSVITFGILLIWVIPYYYQARYNFYQSIKQAVIDDKLIENNVKV